MERTNGYAPIRDYAAVGDGRTVALIARDGSVDWMCTPTFDGPSVFGALLDSARGGRFVLTPDDAYTAERRYVPGTNVLETTYRTEGGRVKVTDALTLAHGGVLPWRELARRVEGLSGSVRLRWRVEPRFDYGRAETTLERFREAVLATADKDALAFQAWGAGELQLTDDAVSGAFTLSEGERALLVAALTHDEPRVLPRRGHVEERLDATCETWRQRHEEIRYDGRWEQAARRSGLVLELLQDAATGAMLAAPTMSLPERIGGQSNFDYRYMWVRDSSFALDAFIQLGLRSQAHASFAWLLKATAHTHPRLQPMYTIDGSPRLPNAQLDLDGYRGSRPVHVGNGAAGQLQLGNFGDLLDTTWLYVEDGHKLDWQSSVRIAEIADLVCEIWQHDDSGIWELKGSQRPYTISKMACWLALDRTLTLAEHEQVPGDHAERWRHERDRIHDYIETACFSERRGSYTMAGDDPEDLDASTLLAARIGYAETGERLNGTIDAVREELGEGPLLYRYSGMQNQEGAFVACSFWLVEALSLAGRLDEAADVMDQMLELANDVGLYSEEIDPATGAFLGNLPQGLSHLALVNAAAVFHRRQNA